MKRKKTGKMITYAIILILAVGLIWLIVGLALKGFRAAGETESFSKSTAFPYDDDNVEIEVEGDPDIDGEKDPAPDNNPNKEPNGESDSPGTGDTPPGETQKPGADSEEKNPGILDDDEPDIVIDADKFFG